MSRQYTKRGAIKAYLVGKLPILKVGKYALPTSFSPRAVQMHLQNIGVLGNRSKKGRVGIVTIAGKTYLHVRSAQPFAEDTNAPTA